MKITACCPTFNRPLHLGRIIKCFTKQTIHNAELVLLDDLGQYDSFSEPICNGNWIHLISINKRFRSLGEKRNAIVGLASSDAIAVWDDDDFYYPWALEALSCALDSGEVAMPRVAIDFDNRGDRIATETFRGNPSSCNSYAFHGCWGYTRQVFERAGRYPSENVKDDSALKAKFASMKIPPANITTEPFYVYNRPFEGIRLSQTPKDEATRDRMGEGATWVGLVPEWTDESDWDTEIPTGVQKRAW